MKHSAAHNTMITEGTLRPDIALTNETPYLTLLCELRGSLVSFSQKRDREISMVHHIDIWVRQNIVPV